MKSRAMIRKEELRIFVHDNPDDTDGLSEYLWYCVHHTPTFNFFLFKQRKVYL